MKDIFNKRQRFSIRKFSVGVASVLIGIALFTPSQGVLASTENNVATEIGANSEKENATPTVEKKEENQNSPENQGAISNPAPKDTPIGSTRTTELETSGNKENNSLTTGVFVAGEDRSSLPAVRAASNPSEIKKYELTKEDAKKIKAGVIGSEGNKLDSLLLNGPELSPEAYTDDDFLKDKEELYIYEKGGKKYVGYNSHPLLEDTDGDGIIDSKEKPDEKLKWNVSERDMIMFMELSYRDDNYIDRVLNHKKPLTESELYKKNDDSRPRYEYMMMNKELGPYWERKKSYHTSSGLDAVLYETKSDFSYLPNGTAQVLAFRGTSDAKDIGTDITLGLGSNPQQGIDAENIMRELAKDKSITNLYLTGHSLGGYLVQRAMVEAYQLAYSDSRVMSSKEQRAYRNFYNNVLKKGTTFNAPKVRTSYFSSSEFWQKGLDSKNIAKSGKMTHYIVNNDSTIGKSVSNDSDVVINVGDTKGGHSSRSYFEADMINRRSEFMSGKRISLDGTGYQDKKMTTAKSVEKVGETVVYSKRGDDIIKSTTVSMKDSDTGQITNNTIDEMFKKDGAKSTVVVTPLEPSVRYERDATRAKGREKVTVAGTPGTRTVTTTYTVNPTDGSLIPHEEPAVVFPSTPTVVKVPAKDEVEYLKEGDNVVKKTTTYAVNASTGSLTPTETTEIFKRNGAKSTVVVTPLEPSVRYERDATRAKGGKNVTTAGTPGTRTVTTTYTINPADGSLIPHEGQPVITPSTPTVVKVPAKDEVEYLKEGDDVVKKTITYAVNASTGALTPTEKKEIFKQNGAKSTVVVTPLEPSVRYEKDATRAKGESKITVVGTPGTRTVTTTYTVNPTDGSLIPHEGQPVIKPSTTTVVKVPAKDKVVETPIESEVEYIKDVEKDFGTPDQRTEGEKGKTVTTTTYDVDPNDGHITEHVGNPVVSPAGKTIVKVGVKTKVEQSKDSEGRDVIDTTTYEVDPKIGKVTPTTVRTYGKTKEPKVEKRVVPSPVVYEKDDTKEKGTAPTTVKGEDGEDTITTTYTVDPNTGKITATEGQPIRTKEPTNTIVKVPAKDKVDVEIIPSPVKYEKDASREKGQANITVPGEDGSKTTATTYTVNPNNGEVIPNEGNPVIVNPTETIVKVATKDKVVYSKDGDNIVKEVTTYTVNPTNGNITEHTTRETFKENGLKDKVEVETIPSPVKYEKDASREKGQANITVPGEDGSKTTATTYTVNPNNGEVIPNEGNPVIVNPTETIVKVATKDKVVYSKDGDNIVKEVTTYTVNPTNGNITEHTTRETFKENGLKDKVEVETIPSPVKYEKDASREKGQANITVPGKDGSKTTTTTYTVDPNSGEAIAHVGEPVIVNPTTTIVKVAAKDEVVTSKDGNNIVKTATTYTVNPDNGNIIEHTTKETFKENGLKDKVDVETIPSPVKYEKDASREKGQANITVPGKDGSKTTTTTYTVNPDNGEVIPNEGNPVIVNPTETIVKVAAKDKVVETPIEPEVEYIKDVEKDFGTLDERTEGEKGKTVTTTTYDVDQNGGHITEHVDTVVTPAGKTIVKVGAKTKVERNKDDQGREVINTTTYKVDQKTGKVTPTTVRTYGKTKEPKVELEQDPKTGDVTVTPNKPDGSTYPPGTTVEIPGKGDKPITVTIGEDGKGKVPNSELPEGKVPGTGKITEPGKLAVEVPVENPAKVTIFENGVLPASIALPKLMIEVRWIDEDGNVLKPSVKTGNEKDAEHGSILGYEFVRTVIAENEPVMTHIFRKVSGTANTTPPKITIFENGVLPASIELPELMIEVRWIDEAGNVLKPSVKTGNEKDAEHGSILGYEFVRTVIDENEPVMTHIFRKVSSNTNTNTIPVVPVTPDANGNSGHDTPAPTTPIPDEVTPNATHEDTTDAIDNGVKSNDSRNVLPNTGTEDHASLAALGLLGALSGFGLVARKKKED